MRQLISFILLLFPTVLLAEAPPYRLHPTNGTTVDQLREEFGQYVEVLEDPGNRLTINDVLSPRYAEKFHQRSGAVHTSIAVSQDIARGAWFRFRLAPNTTGESDWVIGLEGELYVADNNGYRMLGTAGYWLPFDRHLMYYLVPSLPLPVSTTDTLTFYIRALARPIASDVLYIEAMPGMSAVVQRGSLAMGLISGILLAMALYNLMLFRFLRDRSYLYYSLYIIGFLLWLTRNDWLLFEYLWPNSPEFNRLLYNLVWSTTTIFFGLFAMSFLRTKQYAPRLHRLLVLVLTLDSIPVIAIVAGADPVGFLVTQPLPILVMLMLVLVLSMSIIAIRKGYRPARYFLLAYSVWSAGILLTMIDLLHLLPRIALPTGQGDTLTIGAITPEIEVILLSFALAYQVKFMREQITHETVEQERSNREHEEEKRQLLEHEREELDRQVAERTADLRKHTEELEASNTELAATLDHLKSSQSQLIQSEKLSSIGQVTNGISYELREPINFMRNNVSPLQRDVQQILSLVEKYSALGDDPSDEQLSEIAAFEQQMDVPMLVEEIEQLLQGMEEGAHRTAEIVRTVRNFSRLDEHDLKRVNLHEGLDSTLMLLRGAMRDRIEVIKRYGVLPEVECWPGQINQVFMNLLSNAVQSIGNGAITISTAVNDGMVTVSFAGNGLQASSEAASGGTAMAISHDIIRRHGGMIEVGKAMMKIMLPVMQTIARAGNSS